MKKWLLNRLREPSTWRGLVWVLTALGVTLRPEIWEQVTAVGMALAGLLGVFLTDESRNVRSELPPIDLQARPESGHADRGVGAVLATDELRVPADRRPGPAPNISPNHDAVGFGDRD